MRLLQVLKSVGKISGIIFLCFFLIGSLIVFFYGKEIKQLVIQEVNKNLDTKITVEEFDFSVFRHFPLASIELKNVFIEEATKEKEKDTLLYAKRLSLLFKINDVFKNDVTIRKVLVYNGCLNIHVDEKGHGNYHFLKNAETTQASSDVGIEKIGLSNVYLKYIDKKSNQDYAMMAKSAELSGVFGSEKFSFGTKAELFIDHLSIHGENYVNHKPVIIRSTLIADLKAGTYQIEESQLAIGGVDFSASGLVAEKASDWIVDLAVGSKNASITDLQKILPPSFVKYSDTYSIKGKVLFSASIKGSVGHKNIPEVRLDFSVKDGSLSSGDASFSKINLSGNYINAKEGKVNTLTIPSMNAQLAGHSIQANLVLEGLPNAFLTLQAKTQLDLKEIMPFIHSDTLESLSGNLAMNVSFAGKVRELKSIRQGNINQVKAAGNIDISQVNFRLKKNPLVFKNMSGNFVLHNNDIEVRNFCGNVSSSDFCFNGEFKNFISFLLIPGQSGNFRASVNSQITDLDELLVNKSSVNSGDTSYIMKFNPRLSCDLDVKIGKLAFRRFNAEKINGRVNLEKQIISARNLHFKAMGGDVVLDANINASRRDSISMIYDAGFTRVDITRLFYELENFDQQTMTDKNVKGNVSAEVKFYSSWSNDLTLNSSSVRSSAIVTIENGELLNFSPIQKLAKYIHVPDLNHIRFSTMKNNISIANRKIIIPNMDINSSAINISGNGIHDFDNTIDYHLAILLSDVLGKKANSNSSEFGEIADDGLGRTKLLISMKGSVDNPAFSYDRKAAGLKIKENVVREKQNLKGLLKQEFGLYKSDPSVQLPKPKKKEELQIDWSQ